MKLKILRIRNFRCFREEITIDFDDITALIGKNDAGKSTIMEALDLFLNDKDPDKDDASKSGNSKDLTIICEFDELPEEVIIDDNNPTDLNNEFLLNEHGRLEIHKNYSGDLQAPKCKSISAYALHPTVDGAADLLQLKNADLKERAKKLKIDLSGIDTKLNAPIRDRIWKSFKDLKVSSCLIPLNDENAKKIWIGLANYLPTFALFKSDRISTDQDPEAQEPLKAAIKEAIKSKETELTKIAEYVQQEVEKIAQATVDKLKEMDASLATQLKPKFSALKWDSLFKATISSDDDIPINKRGSGVKRLILLNFFRAKSEQKVRGTDKGNIIYGIEEPETSQHPNNQRMLLRALCDLSVDSQVIISTHTPMLARGLEDKNLRYINIKKDKQREILVGGTQTNKQFTESLGVLPDNGVKLFIGVEGKHDIVFLINIAKNLIRDGLDIPNLEQLELSGTIIFFPVGGSNLALWTSRLQGLKRPEFHLCDRDTTPPVLPKYQTYINEINVRPNCRAICTAKKEVENYLHKDAILAAYLANGINLTITNNFADFDDVPKIIAEMVYNASANGCRQWGTLTPERQEAKIKNAKKLLNSTASLNMTKAMLDEIDPTHDLLSWFQEIKSLLV
ncbi:MAG: ATP-binding protein [Candidatus Omnitrophica bacterium]|nr:ATP-binding protein [Candidatus Omnitrophota bacterium]